MITPTQAKDYVQEMQRYTYELVKKKLSTLSAEECLDLANDIVDYSFALMLKTHKGESIKVEDDDIPF